MAKNLELSGMIHAKFATESQMADNMGWSRQRLNNITNGRKVPDLFEVNTMADALGVAFVDLAHIFLGQKSTNVDNIDPLTFMTQRR